VDDVIYIECEKGKLDEEVAGIGGRIYKEWREMIGKGCQRNFHIASMPNNTNAYACCH